MFITCGYRSQKLLFRELKHTCIRKKAKWLLAFPYRTISPSHRLGLRSKTSPDQWCDFKPRHHSDSRHDDFVTWIVERDSVYVVEGENYCGARARNRIIAPDHARVSFYLSLCPMNNKWTIGGAREFSAYGTTLSNWASVKTISDFITVEFGMCNWITTFNAHARRSLARLTTLMPTCFGSSQPASEAPISSEFRCNKITDSFDRGSIR